MDSKAAVITRELLNQRRRSRSSTEQLLPSDLESLMTDTHTHTHTHTYNHAYSLQSHLLHCVLAAATIVTGPVFLWLAGWVCVCVFVGLLPR